ncbi:hypothetical protein ACN3XK_71445 [Actinomadura welshii]
MPRFVRLRDHGSRKWAIAFCAILSLIVITVPSAAAVPEKEAQPAFDFDTGNAVSQVVFPALAQAQGATISADGSDVTFIVDHALLIELTWFDRANAFSGAEMSR